MSPDSGLLTLPTFAFDFSIAFYNTIQTFLFQTALTAAAEHGHLSCIVTTLADKRTDINTPGRMARSGLSFACGNGHDRIVTEFLRQDSCRVNDADDFGALLSSGL
ncbi:hypothetical protein EDB80DRAFT_385006 [Ilyonectria destructans]|nr:hypothetical protein EDB80DRAFT_385006 [Ilyonectria destructans]